MRGAPRTPPEWTHTAFVPLGLAYVTQRLSPRSIHAAGVRSPLCLRLDRIPLRGGTPFCVSFLCRARGPRCWGVDRIRAAQQVSSATCVCGHPQRRRHRLGFAWGSRPQMLTGAPSPSAADVGGRWLRGVRDVRRLWVTLLGAWSQTPVVASAHGSPGRALSGAGARVLFPPTGLRGAAGPFPPRPRRFSLPPAAAEDPVARSRRPSRGRGLRAPGAPAATLRRAVTLSEASCMPAAWRLLRGGGVARDALGPSSVTSAAGFEHRPHATRVSLGGCWSCRRPWGGSRGSRRVNPGPAWQRDYVYTERGRLCPSHFILFFPNL